VVPEGLQARVRRGSWPILPLFKFLQEKGKISEHEMFEVFNMGVGMILIVAGGSREAVLKTVRSAGFSPAVIGEIVRDTSSRVILAD
jgi:phosphoribosylformylglycinamidine cyclo-ligase